MIIRVLFKEEGGAYLTVSYTYTYTHIHAYSIARYAAIPETIMQLTSQDRTTRPHGLIRPSVQSATSRNARPSRKNDASTACVPTGSQPCTICTIRRSALEPPAKPR